MNILYIGPHYSPHFNKWLSPLAKLNSNINFSTVKIHHKSKFIMFMKIFQYTMSSLYLNYQCKNKLIHLHYLGWYTLPAIFVSFISRIPIVVTVWGSDLNIEKSFLASKIQKLTLRRSKYIFCDAAHLEDKLYKTGVTPDKIVRIEFGIDLEQFASIRSKSMSDYSLDTAKIYCNRGHEAIYNYKFILKFFEIYSRKYPGASLHIAGSGSETEIYKKYFKSRRIKNVKFTGEFNRMELMKHLDDADIYISASLYDGGISTSVVEAMAAGKICAIIDILDNSVYAKHMDNAVLFEDGNIEKLINDLETVYEDRLYLSLKEKAQITVQEAFSLEYWAGKIADVYQKC